MTDNETEDWYKAPSNTKPPNRALSVAWAAIKAGVIVSILSSGFTIINSYLFHQSSYQLNIEAEILSILLVVIYGIFYFSTFGALFIILTNYLCKKLVVFITNNKVLFENIFAGIISVLIIFSFSKLLGFIHFIGNLVNLNLISAFIFGVLGNILFNKFMKAKS